MDKTELRQMSDLRRQAALVLQDFGPESRAGREAANFIAATLRHSVRSAPPKEGEAEAMSELINATRDVISNNPDSAEILGLQLTTLKRSLVDILRRLSETHGAGDAP